MRIHIGVLTVSDRCSRNEAVDESGPAVVGVFAAPDYVVEYRAIVADDLKTISTTLRRWVDDFKLDIVLTTGGTGLSPRDVTPEATSKVLDRLATNISTYLLLESIKLTPFAAVGRGIAGIRGETLIVNLPGSPTGAAEQARLLALLLPHAVSVLRGKSADHPKH